MARAFLQKSLQKSLAAMHNHLTRTAQFGVFPTKVAEIQATREYTPRTPRPSRFVDGTALAAGVTAGVLYDM
jgi:hypothetical protein